MAASTATPSRARVVGGAAAAGGLLFAITPLRDVLYGSAVQAGTPHYTVYRLAVGVIVVLLLVGLGAVRHGPVAVAGRPASIGTGLLVVGYLMQLVGAVPAGSAAVEAALGDVGFLGAVVAALGGVPLGIALWRRGVRVAGVLLVLALPAGMPLLVAIAATGADGVAGLAMTLPFGLAWVLIGLRHAAGSRLPDTAAHPDPARSAT